MKLNKRHTISLVYAIIVICGILITANITKSDSVEIYYQPLDRGVNDVEKSTITPTPTPTITCTPTPTLFPTSMPLVPKEYTPEEVYYLYVLADVVNPPGPEHISTLCGVFYGPSGRETYYNLNMGVCVRYMRELGYDEEHYPYWIRSDGAKMLGDYVMVAANWSIRPKGTIIDTSLGSGIVVDTGSFVSEYPYGVDIAVDW